MLAVVQDDQQVAVSGHPGELIGDDVAGRVCGDGGSEQLGRVQTCQFH